MAYQYTSFIWPMLVSATFMMMLGSYAWHHRTLPGATSFAVMVLVGIPWAMGAALELAAVDTATKIFWVQFNNVWGLPTVTAGFCFALEYAHLDRWLNRRTLTLLTIPWVMALLLILTNGVNHLMWTGLTVGEHVELWRGIGSWVLIAYAFSLSALGWVVFLWQFVRSPLYRWPIGLILVGQFSTRIGFLLDATSVNPFAPMDAAVLSFNFSAVMIAFALFKFRMFDIVPIARGMFTEQMREGMLAVDVRDRVVDFNRAAEKILGIRGAQSIGKDISQVLRAQPNLLQAVGDPAVTHTEISLESGTVQKYYDVHISVLTNELRSMVGRLIFLDDVTEIKHTQIQVLERQRALASIAERERLARELHDGLGQVLGYVKMRAQTARDLLAQNQFAAADSCLENLVAVAQDAHTDVREYLLGTGASISTERTFLVALKEYLQQFSEHYAIHTELSMSPEFTDNAFDATVQVQLLRIIQEALTNVRKHACANCVRVSFTRHDSQAQVVIQDDGVGFDPAMLAVGGKFGLRFMHERAEDVAGSVQVQPAPSRGTQVVVRVPIKMESRQRL